MFKTKWEPDLDAGLRAAREEDARAERNQLIEGLNNTPMERLCFSDFAELNAGRDEYSRVRFTALRERVSPEQLPAAEAEFGSDGKLLAWCLRWMLRGLNADKTIRKVRTDCEISDNAAYGPAKKKVSGKATTPGRGPLRRAGTSSCGDSRCQNEKRTHPVRRQRYQSRRRLSRPKA